MSAAEPSSPTPKVLDYSTPTLHGAFWTRWFNAVAWFCFKFQLSDLAVLLVFWLFWSGVYLWLALTSADLTDSGLVLVVVPSVLLAVSLRSLSRLFSNGRPWQRWLLIGTVVCTVPLTGMIQFDSCPHATYLQLMGTRFAVRGHACQNPYNARPWLTR